MSARREAQCKLGYWVQKQSSLYSVEFIAKVEQQNLVEVLSKAHFFSLQADGSTDCATIEDEMYLCLFFDSNGVDG